LLGIGKFQVDLVKRIAPGQDLPLAHPQVAKIGRDRAGQIFKQAQQFSLSHARMDGQPRTASGAASQLQGGGQRLAALVFPEAVLVNRRFIARLFGPLEGGQASPAQGQIGQAQDRRLGCLDFLTERVLQPADRLARLSKEHLVQPQLTRAGKADIESHRFGGHDLAFGNHKGMGVFLPGRTHMVDRCPEGLEITGQPDSHRSILNLFLAHP